MTKQLSNTKEKPIHSNTSRNEANQDGLHLEPQRIPLDHDSTNTLFTDMKKQKRSLWHH